VASVEHLARDFFWLLAPVLSLPLAVSMWLRGLNREFPMFWSFLVLNICRSIASFTFYHLDWGAAYFIEFYSAQVVEVVLSFFVIHELYRQVFHSYRGLRALGSLLFRWAAVVMVLVAGMSTTSRPGSYFDRVWAALMIFDRGSAIALGGLLLLLFLFSGYFGLSWRRHALGIGVGLGIAFSLAIVELAMFSYYGKLAINITSLRSVGFDCGVLVWVGCLMAPEPTVTVPRHPPQHNLDKWNATLQELLAR